MLMWISQITVNEQRRAACFRERNRKLCSQQGAAFPRTRTDQSDDVCAFTFSAAQEELSSEHADSLAAWIV
jgi:hypothetical protein